MGLAWTAGGAPAKFCWTNRIDTFSDVAFGASASTDHAIGAVLVLSSFPNVRLTDRSASVPLRGAFAGPVWASGR